MEHTIKIAQAITACTGDSIKTVVGSCIALCLHDGAKGISGMSHIMMPKSAYFKDKAAEKGKYADTAVPELLGKMLAVGCEKSRLKAKICGGASMFTATPIQGIGWQNRMAVVDLLKSNDIPLIFEDTGGTSGRMVVMDCATGQLFIRALNGESKKG